MKKSRIIGVLSAVLFAIITVSANAALVSRLGGQAIYDTDLNITWISNANLAMSNTFGLPTDVSLGLHPNDDSNNNGQINADGSMNWPGALFWIDAMNVAGYLGFSDWRLPTTVEPDSSCTDDTTGNNPSTDPTGYNCIGGELGHLYYTEINAPAGGIPGLSGGDSVQLAKFTNLNPVRFWTGTKRSFGPPHPPWYFDFGDGSQLAGSEVPYFYAWAAHNGDVGVIPVPAALWLFGSGLLGLVGVARRKKAT